MHRRHRNHKSDSYTVISVLNQNFLHVYFFFFSSRRRHTRCSRDWSSDVCSSDLSRGDPVIKIYVFDTACHCLVTHRSEEHTSELQSRLHLVCRLLLEKKKKP